MDNKFDIFVCDPPWNFSDSLKMSKVKRGAATNYPIMTTKDICDLPIKNIANSNGSVLALWVPSSILDDGLKVMEAWGFSLKQTWIWVKIKKEPFKKLKQLNKKNKLDWNNINWDDFLSFGLGRLGRNVHEVVLIGTMGKVYNKLKNKSQRTVFFASNTKHSKKPEILQDKLEIMYPNQDINKIEIFARRERDGWLCLGNEVGEKTDIRDSLAKLING